MHVTTIGLDLAKHWFQAHGVDANGQTAVRRKLRRSEVLAFLGRCHHAWSAWRHARPRIIGRAS